MRLLLDECVPRRLRQKFEGFQVVTVEAAGFKGLKNGKLLAAAASADFDVLVTVDKNLRYQQNNAKLPMAVLLLSAYSNRVEDLEPLAEDALLVLTTIAKGDFIEIERK
jgi:predicted nuclease of predicted toxin-antitoxin system